MFPASLPRPRNRFLQAKKGLIVYVGKPLQQELLERALATHGAAVNNGDKVQITKLDFQNHEIIVDLNGGGRGKKRLRDRIHIEMAGIPTAQATTEQEEKGPPGLQPGQGSTIYLDFSKPVPDLSPNDSETASCAVPGFLAAALRFGCSGWTRCRRK